MPQTKQQKRISSLSRLKECLEQTLKNSSFVLTYTGAAYIQNLERMIKETEAAIQRGKSYHSVTRESMNA